SSPRSRRRGDPRRNGRQTNTAFSGARGNFNLAELAWLDRAHLLQTNQFEEREKRNHDLNARRHLREQFGEFQRSTFADASKNGFDFIGDSVVLAENLLQFLARFHPLDHVLEGVDQLKDYHLA